MSKLKGMKCFGLLLLVGILLFTARIPARAEESVLDSGTDGTISWELTSDGVLTISGTGEISKAWGSYEYGDSITSIVIEEGITSIGSSSNFREMTNLETISIPASMESLCEDDGGIMFYYCESLLEINVNEDNAVYCSIDGVLYDKDVTTLIKVPEAATEVTIPDTVTEIGDVAFYSCYSLESLELPEGLLVIGSGAFEYCYTSDANLTIPSSVTTIKDSAFYASGVLTSEVTVPASVTYIGDCAFLYCYGLTKIEFECDITEIGTYMLAHCANLASITIPASVTSIGELAFEATGYRADAVEIIFEGDAPSFAENAFSAFTATAYYPADNDTWTDDVMQDYEGTITWVAYTTSSEDKESDSQTEDDTTPSDSTSDDSTSSDPSLDDSTSSDSDTSDSAAADVTAVDNDGNTVAVYASAEAAEAAGETGAYLVVTATTETVDLTDTDVAALLADVTDVSLDDISVLSLLEVYAVGNLEFPLTLTFNIDGLDADNFVAVLHKVDGVWTVESATIHSDGSIMVTVDSLSPFAFLSYSSENETVESGEQEATDDDSSSTASSTDSKDTADVSVWLYMLLLTGAVCGLVLIAQNKKKIG